MNRYAKHHDNTSLAENSRLDNVKFRRLYRLNKMLYNFSIRKDLIEFNIGADV